MIFCVWLERRKWWKIGGDRCFFPCSIKILFLQIWKENRRKRNNYSELPRACLLFFFYFILGVSCGAFFTFFLWLLFLFLCFYSFLPWRDLWCFFFWLLFLCFFSPCSELCCLFIYYIFCFFFPWHELWCYLFIFWV